MFSLRWRRCFSCFACDVIKSRVLCHFSSIFFMRWRTTLSTWRLWQRWRPWWCCCCFGGASLSWACGHRLLVHPRNEKCSKTMPQLLGLCALNVVSALQVGAVGRFEFVAGGCSVLLASASSASPPSLIRTIPLLLPSFLFLLLRHVVLHSLHDHCRYHHRRHLLFHSFLLYLLYDVLTFFCADSMCCV